MVICLEWGADLHMAQLMPLPFTISCFSKIQTGFTFLVPAHPGTYTRLTALCTGLPGWASTRKVEPIWILLKREAVSGSGISWAVCKSAPRSRQITTPAPHQLVFYRPDALRAAQPTVSKHWRDQLTRVVREKRLLNIYVTVCVIYLVALIANWGGPGKGRENIHGVDTHLCHRWCNEVIRNHNFSSKDKYCFRCT